MLESGSLISGVEIFEIVFGGDGVARLEDGAIVFVPFSAVGDVLTVEITEARKNFYKGRIRAIEKAGAGRGVAQCPHYGSCGGCVYQHLAYEAELEAKRAQFRAVMRRIGHFDEFPELEIFMPSPERYGYRNKLRLEPIVSKGALGRGKRGMPILEYGFCERDNRTFFTVASCPLAAERLNASIGSEKHCAYAQQNAKREKPYPMTIRMDCSGKCASYFGKAAPNLPWMKEMLLGEEIRVPTGSFWQVNQAVADGLLQTVRGWLKDIDARALVDAYAGIGTFSLAFGDLFQYRVVIESDAQAIAAAKYNHEQRGLKGHFIAATTESALGNALSTVTAAEAVVVLDPPRTGCVPSVLHTLHDFKPAHIVYVSCNPATLARDLELLCKDNLYVPERASAFDMFPNTAHFESAVLLSLKGN